MITGFNTDVKHKNRVFHIQTEDKGEGNPYVESLVYVGGEILATKRTSYAEVVKAGRDDHAIQDLMEQQHRTMIAAIQRGRFDGPNGAVQVPEGMSPSAASGPPAGAPPAAAPAAPPRSPRPSKAAKVARPPGASEQGDGTAPPGTRVPFPDTDRSLDQMILDYLGSDDVPDEVDLTLSPTPDFVTGRSVQTRLKATSGSPPRPLAGASVQVRILSTSVRASTAFEGKTAADGSCYVSFMVPTFSNGSAAAVIRVVGGRASTEIQYAIKRK
ncbi:MAG TPA: hypothetical protein VMR54_08355 [Thermoanaerobaculia bacterium]|nr:hypothetical protein [Thermoanaerobaculia bacterium]